jgi:proteasome alpha subunit
MREDTMAYDQAITVFSPDGRLYQVEYAREAVKRGATSLGIKYTSGLVLMVEKRQTSRLVEDISIKKLFKLDKHIGCSSAGLVADTQVLVDYMRHVAQMNKTLYNEPITTLELVRKLCNLKRSYTQFGGVRPFGVAFLIGGIDHTGIHLLETDTSGAYMVYDAGCIGQNCQEINEFFEQNYKSGMSKNAAIKLGLNAMKKAITESFTKDRIDILLLERDKEYYLMSPEEIKKHLDKIKSK